MHPIEQESCSDSMVVLVDTREQPNERAKQRYESFGCEYRKAKLNYGDYSINFKLPDGRWYFDESEDIKPFAVVERKMNLEELSKCFCQERERFRKEFERAIENNAKVYLLIENATWEKILHGKYKTKFNKDAFIGSLLSWAMRYNIQIIFCQHEISGKLIAEILKRELKFRLVRGDFDE